MTLAPQGEPDPVLDNYMLLVVVMALFVGGTLVVLSGTLLLCRRCWEVHRRVHRCAGPQPHDLPRRGARTGQPKSPRRRGAGPASE